jgi:hypothetical protein
VHGRGGGTGGVGFGEETFCSDWSASLVDVT